MTSNEYLRTLEPLIRSIEGELMTAPKADVEFKITRVYAVALARMYRELMATLPKEKR